MTSSYCTLSGLILAILLQSSLRKEFASAITNQSHPIIEISDNVCTSRTCNKTAEEILSNIDENVDPCENFYKFSCGGFINKTHIPDSQSSVNAFWIIRNKIRKQLKNIIEERYSPDDPRYVRIIKNFYKSCMNKAAIEERGLEPLKKLLKDLGGWPVLEGEQWNDNDFDWLDLSYKFNKAGISNGYFMSFGIGSDLKNNTNKYFKFGEPYLEEYHDALIEGMDNIIVKAYYNVMVDIAVLLGALRDNAITELTESLEFEIELAKIMVPQTESRNLTRFHIPITINELSEKYPSILWKKFINNILAPHFIVDDDEIVILIVPEFIPKFINLISMTPKRVQSNYAMWKLITNFAKYLNQNITTRLSEYHMELTGNVKSEPRWMGCVEELSKLKAVHSMYVKKYFNPTAKDKSMEMISEIIDQLKDTLRTIDWMDDETRTKALEKAAAISVYVGYPSQLLNETLLEEYYENVDFNDDTFFENELTYARNKINNSYCKFREPIDNTAWDKHATAADVNAFYNPEENSIEFPAGILQGIFFDKNRPKYINYGAIGSIIGHEITHAFDDEGRQFDERGNLKNWWTSDTNEKFHQKAQCIIDQYSSYTIEEVGKNLNGFNTQSENIADNGGFKIAYLAYKNWAQKHRLEKTLPGLKYSPEQLFWLSAANTWCSKSRKESLEYEISTNSHSPIEFRIFGSFRNLPEFAADFNCPIGSKMNPEDKCTFW